MHRISNEFFSSKNTVSVSDQATFHANVSTSSEDAEKLRDQLASHWRPRFIDITLETVFVRHISKKAYRQVFGAWLVCMVVSVWNLGNTLAMIDLTRPLVGVEVFILVQQGVTACMIQGFWIVFLIPRSWLSIDTGVTAVVTAISVCVILGGEEEIGALLEKDSQYVYTYLRKSNSRRILEFLVSLAITAPFLMLSFIRVSRSWMSLVAVWLTYVGYCFTLSVGTDTFFRSMLVVGALGVLAPATWINARKSEILYRLDWLRARTLKNELQELQQKVERKHEKHHAVKQASLQQTKLVDLMDALEGGSDACVNQAKQKLQDCGLRESEVDEHVVAMRRKLSEEAGVSLAYLLPQEFQDLAQAATGEQDPHFYEISQGFFFKEKGIPTMVVCMFESCIGNPWPKPAGIIRCPD